MSAVTSQLVQHTTATDVYICTSFLPVRRYIIKMSRRIKGIHRTEEIKRGTRTIDGFLSCKW